MDDGDDDLDYDVVGITFDFQDVLLVAAIVVVILILIFVITILI